MSDEDKQKEFRENIKVTDKKIQFGEPETICFACGEKIASEARVCPFCKTVQDKRS